MNRTFLIGIIIGLVFCGTPGQSDTLRLIGFHPAQSVIALERIHGYLRDGFNPVSIEFHGLKTKKSKKKYELIEEKRIQQLKSAGEYELYLHEVAQERARLGVVLEAQGFIPGVHLNQEAMGDSASHFDSGVESSVRFRLALSKDLSVEVVIKNDSKTVQVGVTHPHTKDITWIDTLPSVNIELNKYETVHLPVERVKTAQVDPTNTFLVLMLETINPFYPHIARQECFIAINLNKITGK